MAACAILVNSEISRSSKTVLLRNILSIFAVWEYCIPIENHCQIITETPMMSGSLPLFTIYKYNFYESKLFYNRSKNDITDCKRRKKL